MDTFQDTEPAGASAPVAPVTVAVKVIDPPRIGLDGEEVTTIDGVACPTSTESDAADKAEKLVSPL